MRSVRFRMTLWHTIALAAIILVFALGVYFQVRASLFRQLDQQLQERFAAISAMVAEEIDELHEIDSEYESLGLFEIRNEQGFFYQTEGWRRTGLTSASPGEPGETLSWLTPDGHSYRLLHAAFQVEDRAETIEFVATVARSEDGVRQSLLTLTATLMLGLPCAILLAVMGGYFLAGRALSPIGAMADKAEQITADRLSERLPVKRPDDEFGRLATAFNQTLARLEDSFERLRRFTADVSHELRTPLTALRSEGEVALRRSNNGHHHRETIGSMLEEVDRLTHLCDSLLVLTRADEGRIPLERERIDLMTLIEEVVDYLRVLAEEKDQIILACVNHRIEIEADRGSLRQALINILDNAIKYSPPGARIKISLRHQAPDHAAIEVSDPGPGIPAEDGARVFDRFYRVEHDRSRETGGTGLGLSIARWAVEANRGRIELESSAGEGSTFRIVLPVRS